MNSLRGQSVLSAAALALSAASATSWLAGQVVVVESFAGRAGLLLASLVVSGGLLELLLRKLTRQEREARLTIERLCSLDSFESINADALPELDPKSPWFASLNLVKEFLAQHANRVLELDHARAALEIRYRRAQAQCERMSRVVASLSEPVMAVDHYDTLLLANPSARKLFGFSLDETMQPLLSEAVHCDKLNALMAETRRRKLRASRVEELEITGVGGDKRSYSVTMTSLPTASELIDGESDGQDDVAVVFRDISAAKLIQRQNAEFVSAASHEMKAPLAGIKAYVELLADGDAEDEATREEFLGVINNQADRLQRLIENLLNLARIEAGVVKVSKQSQSLNDILAEAFQVMQPSAQAKQIALVEELSPLYLGVLADRDMLLQTAINLLSNAIKYTPHGGHVTLRSRLLDREAQFEVEDTGVGLTPDDCQKVFGKFYRVEGNKHMAPGTGLGLPLAKTIVEEVHGGRLTVASKLGEGSTFTVTIPAVLRGTASLVAVGEKA